MSQTKNIIIGAGISGLACASVLKESLVLEKEGCIGGLAKTIRFNGFSFDLGGHRFFTNQQDINIFVANLLDENIINKKRVSKVYKNGKFINYPLRLSVIFQMPPWEIASSISTYIFRKLTPLAESSFEERVINRFGSQIYKVFFKDYTEKVWGIPCDNISKELAEIRLQSVSLTEVIKHVFNKNDNIKTFSETLIYPKQGIYKIAEALSRNLEIKLNSEVTGLISNRNRIEKVIINNSTELPCKNLISTMPITRIIDFLNAPISIKEAAKKLKYRSVICVFLTLDIKQHTDNHWIYLHGESAGARLHEPKNWSSGMAPENETGICVEIFCDSDEPIWEKTNAQIAELAIKSTPLITHKQVKDFMVVKAEYAYPIYDLHFDKNSETVRNYLSSYKNLFLLGRTGNFKYINMDLCIAEGLRLGNLLSKSE